MKAVGFAPAVQLKTVMLHNMIMWSNAPGDFSIPDLIHENGGEENSESSSHYYTGCG